MGWPWSRATPDARLLTVRIVAARSLRFPKNSASSLVYCKVHQGDSECRTRPCRIDPAAATEASAAAVCHLPGESITIRESMRFAISVWCERDDKDPEPVCIGTIRLSATVHEPLWCRLRRNLGPVASGRWGELCLSISEVADAADAAESASTTEQATSGDIQEASSRRSCSLSVAPIAEDATIHSVAIQHVFTAIDRHQVRSARLDGELALALGSSRKNVPPLAPTVQIDSVIASRRALTRDAIMGSAETSEPSRSGCASALIRATLAICEQRSGTDRSSDFKAICRACRFATFCEAAEAAGSLLLPGGRTGVPDSQTMVSFALAEWLGRSGSAASADGTQGTQVTRGTTDVHLEQGIPTAALPQVVSDAFIQGELRLTLIGLDNVYGLELAQLVRCDAELECSSGSGSSSDSSRTSSNPTSSTTCCSIENKWQHSCCWFAVPLNSSVKLTLSVFSANGRALTVSIVTWPASDALRPVCAYRRKR
jgi:hypothetical protein